jgi:hypothetical protein
MVPAVAYRDLKTVAFKDFLQSQENMRVIFDD